MVRMAWHGMKQHHGIIYMDTHNGLYEPNMLKHKLQYIIIHFASLDSSVSILFSKSALLNQIR
jgi:hypothetical protein